MSGRRPSAGAGRTRTSAPSRLPLIPGQPCPQERTSKKIDPAVTDVARDGATGRTGTRTCRCGQAVTVRQSVEAATGFPLNAWSYDAHTVPTNEGGLNGAGVP